MMYMNGVIRRVYFKGFWHREAYLGDVLVWQLVPPAQVRSAQEYQFVQEASAVGADGADALAAHGEEFTLDAEAAAAAAATADGGAALTVTVDEAKAAAASAAVARFENAEQVRTSMIATAVAWLTALAETSAEIEAATEASPITAPGAEAKVQIGMPELTVGTAESADGCAAEAIRELALALAVTAAGAAGAEALAEIGTLAAQEASAESADGTDALSEYGEEFTLDAAAVGASGQDAALDGRLAEVGLAARADTGDGAQGAAEFNAAQAQFDTDVEAVEAAEAAAEFSGTQSRFITDITVAETAVARTEPNEYGAVDADALVAQSVAAGLVLPCRIIITATAKAVSEWEYPVLSGGVLTVTQCSGAVRYETTLEVE